MGDTAIGWRAIPDWPNYEISPTGQVRRTATGRPIKLRNREGTRYLYFTPARGRKLYVHTAVLAAFVGPRPAGHEARHLDGDPSNNTCDNLAWGTPKENAEDKRRHGTIPHGERAGTAKLTEEAVLDIRSRYRKTSLRALASEFGVSHTAIRRAATGFNWRHLSGVAHG